MDQGIGREIQIDLYRNNEAGGTNNPNEGGDDIGWYAIGREDAPTANPNDWVHGSPLTQYSVTSSGSTTTLTTEVFPLLYTVDPTAHQRYVTSGLDTVTHPVMWRGRIGKTVTLGAYPAHPGIILWTTNITIPNYPSGVPGQSAENISNFEPISVHVNNEFDQFWLYDTLNGGFSQENVPVGKIWDPSPLNGSHGELSIVRGGVIVATRGGNYAIGLYKNFALRTGGYNPGFMLNNNTDGNGDVLQDTSYNCSKIGWGEYPYNYFPFPVNNFPPGYRSNPIQWNFYLIVGSLNDVKASMQYLYKIGL